MINIIKHISFSILLTLILIGCYSSTGARYIGDSTYSTSNFSKKDIDYTSMSIGDKSILSNSNKKQEGTFGKNERMIIHRDHSLLNVLVLSGKGKIFNRVCFDRNGDAVAAEIDTIHTTITNQQTLADALLMVSGYKVEIDTLAPEYQCGEIKFIMN